MQHVRTEKDLTLAHSPRLDRIETVGGVFGVVMYLELLCV